MDSLQYIHPCSFVHCAYLLHCCHTLYVGCFIVNGLFTSKGNSFFDSSKRKRQDGVIQRHHHNRRLRYRLHPLHNLSRAFLGRQPQQFIPGNFNIQKVLQAQFYSELSFTVQAACTILHSAVFYSTNSLYKLTINCILQYKQAVPVYK